MVGSIDTPIAIHGRHGGQRPIRGIGQGCACQYLRQRRRLPYGEDTVCSGLQRRCLVLLAGLIVWVAGNARLGMLAVGGFAAALGGFWILARLFIAAISRLRGGAGFGWRYKAWPA